MTIDHVHPSEDAEPLRLPSYKGMVAYAVEFAAMCLRNQYDKQEQPAILHAVRVMLQGQTDLERVVGVLHDVLEDSPVTKNDLLEQFGPVVAEAVQRLTRDRDMPYTDYIAALASHPVARQVKLYDLQSNIQRYLDASRGTIPESLHLRYIKAYAYLFNYALAHKEDGM